MVVYLPFKSAEYINQHFFVCCVPPECPFYAFVIITLLTFYFNIAFHNFCFLNICHDFLKYSVKI